MYRRSVAVLLLLLPALGSVADTELPALEHEAPEEIDLTWVALAATNVAERFPSEQYDVDVLAEQFGDDPLAAFEFVRDEIAFEPYPGILRGPSGTLAARAGNHYDRSLLLKALLDRQGIRSRLVSGQLSGRSAGPLKERPLAARASTGTDDPSLAVGGLGAQALARLQARAARDYQWLSAALAEPSASLKPVDSADIERSAHVWVQARLLGEWQDLDTSLRLAEPGDSLGHFTKEIKQPVNSDYHYVSVAVVAESLSPNGQLQENRLLQQRIRADSGAQQQLFLMFQPGAASSGIGGAVMHNVGMEKQIHPVLMIDGELTQGAVLPPLGNSGNSRANGFFDIESAQPVLVRLHLDLSVQQPGGGIERRRTTILDRISRKDAATRSYALERLNALKQIENGAPSVYGSIHQILISNGGANPLDAAADIIGIVDLLQTATAADDDSGDLSFDAMLWSFGALNRNLTLAAERHTLTQINNDANIRFYVDRPRVYLMSVMPEMLNDEPYRSVSIDLVHDHLGWFAAPGAAASTIVDARLRYGTLQSALETTFVELRSRSDVVSASTRFSGNLSEVSRQAVSVESERFPSGLKDDVLGGALVLTTEDAGDAIETWWRFDRKNGSLVAKLEPTKSGAEGGGGAPTVRSGGSNQRGWSQARIRVVDWTEIYPEDDLYPEKQRRALERLRARNRALGRRACGGGKEYLVLFGCVSLPAGVSLGLAYFMVWSEIILGAGYVAAITNEATR